MKKKFFSIFVLACSAMLFASCDEKEVDEDFDPSTSFLVEMAPMVNENGTKATFTNSSYSELVYDEGDVIYVNNVPFTLRKKNDKWVAQGTSSSMTNATRDTLLGKDFSCLYYSSPAVKLNYSSGRYRMSFIPTGTVDGDFTFYNSGMVLAGRTSDSLVTLYPTFAVIRFYTRRDNIDKLYIALDDEILLNTGTVTPVKGGKPTMSNTSCVMYAPGEDSDPFGSYYFGDFIYAVKDGVKDGGRYQYHAIVPLANDNVSTDIYIGWKLSDGQAGSTKTTSKVTLNRGVVYTINLQA